MKKANYIVYTSQTGFTRQYARMLSEAAGLPCYSLEESPHGGSAVYLGWLSAGKIVGLDRAKKKHLVVACCAVGRGETGQTERLEAQLPGGKVFYLRGGYAPDKQRGVNRVMMTLFGHMMKRMRRDDLSVQRMAEDIRVGADYVSRQQLRPVLDWMEE